jgi:hypothetical protein
MHRSAPAVPDIAADDAYRVAALFDGARRIAHTALCVLALEDVIDLGRDIEAAAVLRDIELVQIQGASDAGIVPTVAITGAPTAELHQIEREALDLIGGETPDVDTVVFELRRSPEMHRIIRECIDRHTVRRDGSKRLGSWPDRWQWGRSVPASGDLDALASRRLVLAVHGPVALFEVAPEIPLALGYRRRPRESAWLMSGHAGTFGGGDGGGAGGDCGGGAGGDCG